MRKLLKGQDNTYLYYKNDIKKSDIALNGCNRWDSGESATRANNNDS